MNPWPALLSLLALAPMAPPEGRGEPVACLETEVRRIDRDLHRRYLYETNGAQGLRHYGEEGSNESILLPGSDRLVILWHGFMASPPEMRPLGEHLHRALGATIYIPLIPGFGSGHRVADEFKLDAWRRSVSDAIERAGRCHSRVALVGYSIGGGLVADYVLASAPGATAGIRSLVLLSPYIETAGWMLPGLRTHARAGFLHFLRSGLRLRRVHLNTIHKLSRRRYRDLSALLADPNIYDQRFSLRAGINMLHLTRRRRRLPADAVSDLPTLLAVSEADQTVSWSFTEDFVGRHIRGLKATVRYERAASIAHQIVVPEVNPRFADLYDAVADFLTQHFEGAD